MTITKDDFSSINLTEILNDTKYFHDYSFKFADLCKENFSNGNLKASNLPSKLSGRDNDFLIPI